MSKILVCEICRSEKCDGKIYQAYSPPSFGGRGDYLRRVCTSEIEVYKGKLYYRNIIGHGEMEMLEVTPE
jgi:hypothetical protein